MNTDSLKRGAIAGFVGGVPFGVMMGMMGMLTMIGGMVGMPSAGAGFLIHMMMSAMIGAGFGLIGARYESRRQLVVAGLLYGAAWWVLGPLTVMPGMMGMGLAANWSAAGVVASLPSLMGHMVFGLVTGLVYHRTGGAASPTAIPA